VVDFKRQTPRWRFSDRDIAHSLFLRRDANNIRRPVFGDSTGTVWLMDQTARSKDGAGFRSEFQTAHIDLSDQDPSFATRNKHWEFVEIVTIPSGNWNLNCDVILDGITRQTVTFNMGVTGAVLGSFILGTDVLAGDQVINRRRRIVGQARRCSLRFYQETANQDFSVAKVLLYARLGDEGLETSR